jgi:ketosteroid isomerase-like protein
MKKQVSIVLSTIIFLLLNGLVYSQDNPILQRQLETQYKKLAEAYAKRNLKTIAALKTPDFHAVFIDDKVGDAKTMQKYAEQFLNINQSPLSIKFTIQKLTVSENRLVAVADTFQQAVRYQELSGKRRKVETSAVQSWTWIKTPGGWKLKLIDSLRDRKRFVDGKPVDPMKPYNPDDPPYVSSGIGELRIHDKNSPVWQELEDYYKKANEAYINKDLETTLKLRELLTIETPDGRLHPPQEVAESTKAQFQLNQNILKISYKILNLTTEGNKAVAFIRQEFSRMQNLAGKLRRVDSSIDQTEVFVKTADGWRVKYIKILGPQIRYVDGKRVDPTKPYNPDDPPYNPDDAGIKKQ